MILFSLEFAESAAPRMLAAVRIYRWKFDGNVVLQQQGQCNMSTRQGQRTKVDEMEVIES
jgi:hypothetical protein